MGAAALRRERSLSDSVRALCPDSRGLRADALHRRDTAKGGGPMRQL